MKRILFVVGFLAAVATALAQRVTLSASDLELYQASALELANRAGDYIAANPVPFAVALGTFLATVLYHKARGKTLRESVEAAATRVTVVTVPAGDTDETPVVKRARARATRTQLLTDQIGLQNRQRKLPDEIIKAQKEVCHLKQFLTDTEKTLALRTKAHADAVAKLELLEEERDHGEDELHAIDAELKKLAVLV